MINFFKREFGPYFRDFSEYDFKFFRTFRDAFVRPTKIIEANDGTYTGELKFTFNVFTILFVIYYLYNSAGIHVGDFQMWKYPLPHQRYVELNKSIEEDYFGYITAIAFIPFYFLSLKLLFFRKKPWGFFLSASFYLTSVMFTLFIVLAFVLNSLDIESELIIIPTFFFISVYPVIALRIQHWFWSTLKGVIAVIFPFVISSALMLDMLDNLIINLIQNEEVLEMKPSNELVVKADALEFEPGGIQQVEMIDHNSFIVMGGDNISWFEKEIISASIPLTDYHSKKMLLLNESGPLLVVCYHEYDGVLEESVMTLYSMKGDTLWNKRMNASNPWKTLSFTRSDRDTYLIYSLGNRVSLSKTNNKWVGDVEVLPTSDVLTEFQSTDRGDFRIITKKGNHHIISYSLEFVGFSDTIHWTRDIYVKSGPFDPLDELTISYDSSNQTIYTHYTLANDSTYEAHLNAIDIKTGQFDWSNSITIPAHVTEYEGLTFDDDYLYLYGEGHKFYSEWFWQPTYHIGLLVKADKKTGVKLNHVFLGPNENWDAHSHIYGVSSVKDSIILLTYDQPKESIMGEDTDDLILKSMSKDF